MTEDEILKTPKYWYYSKQRQTGIMVSIIQGEKGDLNVSIRDKYGKIEPAFQDVPVLIEMLKRLLRVK